MLGDYIISWRYSLIGRSRATRQSMGGGLDPSLTLRVGMVMAEANQSTLPITTRRVSEGWRSLYGPTGRADDDISD